MNDFLKENCDRIVAASLEEKRISKKSVITKPLTKRTAVTAVCAEELLGQFAQMYLIPPDEKIEISEENTIESSVNVVYDEVNELTEVVLVDEWRYNRNN